MTTTANTRASTAGAAVRASAVYWLAVFPRVRRQIGRWEARAEAIPDPALREQARRALDKRGNIEGAAAFAAFVPRARRGAAAQALAAFQSAYNYLDVLGEQPSADPVANGRRLHEALLVALEGPAAAHPDYYEHHPQREDGGYLAAMIDSCRSALAALPSWQAVAPAARAAARRIVDFQSLNLTERQGGLDAFARWGAAQTPAGTGLEWWETAAAGGSSLGVYALIAAAAEPAVAPGEAGAIEEAYFPWIGALHSLLDSLVDLDEDAAAGHPSLMGHYASRQDAGARMTLLAERAVRTALALPHGERHAVTLAAMASYYLSTPAARAPGAQAVSREVLGAIDRSAGLPSPLTGAMHVAGRLAHGIRESTP